MAITGTDTLSLDILRSLEKGTKVKDILSRFPLSLDQAKRLSRFRNILKKANMHLLPIPLKKLICLD